MEMGRLPRRNRRGVRDPHDHLPPVRLCHVRRMFALAFVLLVDTLKTLTAEKVL